MSFRGTDKKPIGVAEFVAQEEMSRYRGYWWSADENFIATTHVDLTPVEIVERFEIYSEKVEVVKQAYPKTGKANAIVSLLVFDRSKAGKNQPATPIPIEQKDYYIPHGRWTKDKKNPPFSFGVQSRDQKELNFYLFDPRTKKKSLLFTENDPAWINLRHDYKFLKDSPGLLWVSEEDGFSHLYHYDLKTKKKTQLTNGSWSIRSLVAVDHKQKLAFFMGTQESPLENHLYSVSFNQKSEPKKITEQMGFHRVEMVDDPSFYLDYFSTSSRPTSLASYDLKGKLKFLLKRMKLLVITP